MAKSLRLFSALPVTVIETENLFTTTTEHSGAVVGIAVLLTAVIYSKDIFYYLLGKYTIESQIAIMESWKSYLIFVFGKERYFLELKKANDARPQNNQQEEETNVNNTEGDSASDDGSLPSDAFKPISNEDTTNSSDCADFPEFSDYPVFTAEELREDFLEFEKNFRVFIDYIYYLCHTIDPVSSMRFTKEAVNYIEYLCQTQSDISPEDLEKITLILETIQLLII